MAGDYLLLNSSDLFLLVCCFRGNLHACMTCMNPAREKFFQSRVLKNLYPTDENSSEEDSDEELGSQPRAKQMKTSHAVQKSERTSTHEDWPVPPPKIKRVYTVSVQPEDLGKIATKTGKDDTTSTSSLPQHGNTSNSETTSGELEPKISKNKKRKLKKKRHKEKIRQSGLPDNCTPSREFTY